MKLTLNLAEGDYARLIDALLSRVTNEMMLEAATNTFDEIAALRYADAVERANERIANIVSVSLTGEARRAVERKIRTLEHGLAESEES